MYCLHAICSPEHWFYFSSSYPFSMFIYDIYLSIYKIYIYIYIYIYTYIYIYISYLSIHLSASFCLQQDIDMMQFAY